MSVSLRCSQVLLSILAILISGCSRPEPPPPEPVIKPIKTVVVGGERTLRRSFPGKVQAAQRVNIAFRVGGPLTELPVKEGDNVRAGQVIAKIDTRDYVIARDAARARFQKARADYSRARDLYANNTISVSDLEIARTANDVAKAELDKAEANLTDCVLKAPFAGFIGDILVDNFEDVRPRQDILSLNDISELEVVIDLPENLVAQLKRGIAARIVATFETAPGREFPVTFKEASAQADPRTQTYRTTFAMRQPDGINVLPGMTATVTGEATGEGATVRPDMVIPSVAVFPLDGRSYVWIVDEETSTVKRREVEVGDLTGIDGIRIVSGLEHGERVCVVAVNLLEENQKIRVMD